MMNQSEAEERFEELFQEYAGCTTEEAEEQVIDMEIKGVEYIAVPYKHQEAFRVAAIRTLMEATANKGKEDEE